MDTEQLLAAEDTAPLGRSRADVLDMLTSMIAGPSLGVAHLTRPGNQDEREPAADAGPR
jgi:hypothetical protein